ncbi:hypothetical protein ACQEV9_45885 [Streptomyces chartreusis]|uniref:hypothetical protein n=1 Tax=Streptomyces chartreusis TaxID=1969 RepID=UPI003D8BC7CB
MPVFGRGGVPPCAGTEEESWKGVITTAASHLSGVNDRPSEPRGCPNSLTPKDSWLWSFLGIVMAVFVQLTLRVTRMLDSMVYRVRARGRAEIIRGERGLGLPERQYEAQGTADG